MAQTILNARYELLQQLGEGGVAIVYRAHDTLLDRTVAVKVLREQLTGDPAFVERFRREAQAAARLSHPNITAIYDVGQDGNQHYIVMEYVEGPDLKSLITSSAPLSIALALGIAEQVCAALEHAHEQGFVHRDIKPQNILLARPGAQAATATPVVKVADFGLARSVSAVSMADGGLVLGTVQYVSPEQARGEPATPASDIYALGVVLYEMLSGHLPFESETAVGLALKHIQDPVPPPSRANPLVPPSVDAFVLRAMAKEPAQRFASAKEMGSALATYRQFGESATGQFAPLRARPTPPRATTARPAARVAVAAPARRHTGFDWLLLVLLLVTFVAIAGLVPLAAAVRDTVFPSSPTPLPQVPVPNVTGLEQAVAEAQLQALGLALVVQDGRFDDNVPAQHIIAQLVPVGTLLAQGETVEVVVSRGHATVTVPPVTGLAFSEAQSRLSALGLASDRTDAPSPQVAAGIVAAQDPAAEAQAARGSTVHLTVSAGDRVVVPDLFGKSEAEAQALIRDAGLATTVANAQAPEDVPAQSRWVFSAVPVGAVISQAPQAGALVDRGTLVRIAIRKR